MATKELLEAALLAELVIADPDVALWFASRQARRCGSTVLLPTLASAFASVDAAMSDLQSHEDHNEAP